MLNEINNEDTVKQDNIDLIAQIINDKDDLIIENAKQEHIEQFNNMY